MSKRKSGHGVLSGRALRRYNEREEAVQQREAEKIARARSWLAMSPEERLRRVKDEEVYRRIEKNGIRIDDMMYAENEAYKKGLTEGKDATFRKIFAAICLSLHEKHGFDDEQCTDVLNDVYDRAVYALSTDELVREAFDEVGIELCFDGEALDGPVSVKED